MDTVLGLIALSLLLGLNYIIFLNIIKVKLKTSQGFNLSNLFRVQFFLHWFLFSIKSSLFIFMISYLYTKILIPGLIYCSNLDEDFWLIILFIVLIVGPQVSLILYFFNKTSLLQKFYLFCYIISLRFILVNVIIIFVSKYNSLISEELLLILSTGIYSVLCESGVFEQSLLLYFKSIITKSLGIEGGILDKFIKSLLDYYRSSFLKYRMLPFNSRLYFYNHDYIFTSSKLSLFKGKLLNKGYYPSQFQPYTLPQIVEFRLTNNLSSFSLDCETYVYSWDDKTWVESYCDSETVVESEIDFVLEVCNNKVKLTDPQLSLSVEYLNDLRVQSVFVNKGKGIATDSDINSYNQDNSENIMQNTGSNEVTGWDDNDIIMATNESRQTHRYNTIVGESSSIGARMYDQGQSNSSSSIDTETSREIGEVADRFNLALFESSLIPGTKTRSHSSSSLSSMNNSELEKLEMELELYRELSLEKELALKRAFYDHAEQNLSQGAAPSNLSSSDLSSVNSEISGEFYFSNSTTGNLIPTHIWDYDLTKCETEFRLFLETIDLESLFDSELLNKLREMLGQDENGDMNSSDSELDNEINNSSSSSGEVISIDRGKVKSKTSNPKIYKKKVHKNKYYEMSYLLSMRKNNLLTSIKNSKVITEKDDKLEKSKKLYEEILKKLIDNKASQETLESMRNEIESFSHNILGFPNHKKLGPLSYRVRGAKKEIFTLIHKNKSHIGRRIRKSNWENKEIKLRIFNKKIESIRSMVENDSSSAHNQLKNNVIAKLNKLKLSYQNNIKWSKRTFLSYTENDERLNLLFSLYQKIRLDLIRPFSVQMRSRIYKAPLSNNNIVYSKFIDEIRILKKEMYSCSNIEFALHIVLTRLIQLNEKHNYDNVNNSTIYNWNHNIINLLKKIIKDIIK